MSDLISRQAAVDAVQQHREGVLGGYEYDEGVAFVYAAAHNHIIDVIKRLPSAQPEIVRCKECKRQDTDNVFRSMWCYEMRTFVKPNEFCSRADMRGEQDG